MKTLFLLSTLLLSLNSIVGQDLSTNNSIDKEKLQLIMSEANVPSISIATIEHGKIKELVNLGSELGETETSDLTLYDVASLTKTITTLVTLKLVENLDWSLDEPLRNYYIDPLYILHSLDTHA